MRGGNGITTVFDINFQAQIRSQDVLSMEDMTYFFNLEQQLAVVLKHDLLYLKTTILRKIKQFPKNPLGLYYLLRKISHPDRRMPKLISLIKLDSQFSIVVKVSG